MSGVKDVKQHAEPVYITLGEEKHRLQYDMNAFAELEKRFGTLNAALDSISSGRMTDIRLILWAGIIHDQVEEFDEITGEPIKYKVTPYQLGSHIQMTDLPEISELLAKAFSGSMPSEEAVKASTAKIEQATPMVKQGNFPATLQK